MARSSILLPQALQLYVQLLQMREPSPSRSRLASESSRVPHVLQRKQSMCHRLPAVNMLEECVGVIRRTLQIHTKLEGLALLQYLRNRAGQQSCPMCNAKVKMHTSPQPLHG